MKTLIIIGCILALLQLVESAAIESSGGGGKNVSTRAVVFGAAAFRPVTPFRPVAGFRPVAPFRPVVPFRGPAVGVAAVGVRPFVPFRRPTVGVAAVGFRRPGKREASMEENAKQVSSRAVVVAAAGFRPVAPRPAFRPVAPVRPFVPVRGPTVGVAAVGVRRPGKRDVSMVESVKNVSTRAVVVAAAGFRPVAPRPVFRPVVPVRGPTVGVAAVGVRRPGKREAGESVKHVSARAVVVAATAFRPAPVPLRPPTVGVAAVGVRRPGKRDFASIVGGEAKFLISTEAMTIQFNIDPRQKIACPILPNLIGTEFNGLHYKITETKASSMKNRFTLKPVSAVADEFFVYPSDSIIEKPGFIVKDRICYDAIVDAFINELPRIKADVVVF